MSSDHSTQQLIVLRQAHCSKISLIFQKWYFTPKIQCHLERKNELYFAPVFSAHKWKLERCPRSPNLWWNNNHIEHSVYSTYVNPECWVPIMLFTHVLKEFSTAFCSRNIFEKSLTKICSSLNNAFLGTFLVQSRSESFIKIGGFFWSLLLRKQRNIHFLEIFKEKQRVE